MTRDSASSSVLGFSIEFPTPWRSRQRFPRMLGRNFKIIYDLPGKSQQSLPAYANQLLKSILDPKKVTLGF